MGPRAAPEYSTQRFHFSTAALHLREPFIPIFPIIWGRTMNLDFAVLLSQLKIRQVANASLSAICVRLVR